MSSVCSRCGSEMQANESIKVDEFGYVSVSWRNEKVKLGGRDASVLRAMLKAHPLIRTKEEIINDVWGDNNNVTDGRLAVHVSRVRTAVADLGLVIRNVYGKGYSVQIRNGEKI
jgi:DNA-binding winged helix-turn-helix (wHTH) protein